MKKDNSLINQHLNEHYAKIKNIKCEIQILRNLYGSLNPNNEEYNLEKIIKGIENELDLMLYNKNSIFQFFK